MPAVPQDSAVQSGAIPTTGIGVQPVKTGYLRGNEKGLRLWGEQAQQILISAGRDASRGAQQITVTSSDTNVLTVGPPRRQGTFTLQAVTHTDASSNCASCKVVTPGNVTISITVTSPGSASVTAKVPVHIDHKIVYVSMNPLPNASFGSVDALLQYYDDNASPSVIWDDFAVHNANSITNIEGIAVGGDGTLYAASPGNGVAGTGAVTEYPSGTSNPVPVKTLSSPSLLAPWAVAVDAPGNVYVADASKNETLTRFPVGGPPVTLLNGWPQGSLLDGVASDANGDLTVTMADVGFYKNPGNTNVGALAVINATFGSNSNKTLQINSTTSNGVNEPYGAAIAADGNLYVVNDYSSIVSQGSSGATIHSTLTRYRNGLKDANTLPDATITTGLAWPMAVAVDTAGTVYVANNTPLQGHTNSNFVTTYEGGFASGARPLSTVDLAKTLPASYSGAFLNIQGIAVYPGPLQK